MTTLVIEELVTTLSQEFTINSEKGILLKSIRPYLYVHNNPVGTFTVKLKQGITELFSKNFQSSDLYNALSTSNAYAHLFFNIEFDYPIHLIENTYKIELSSSGYSFSEASYIAWIKEHENLKVPLSYSPLDDLNNPMSFELWSYKND